ncbi:MAG: DUF2061 domain-containing protein [Candidatus Omnitrophica bacterium]|nr:DUF2061 domain-containing protein [Candidatus Omnitrophota bacterium]
MKEERRLRTIIKAITWRLVATITTILVVFLFTKKIMLSLEVGGVALILKLMLYYFHERVWGKVSWGKPKHPLEDIPVKKELTPEDKKKVEDQLKSLGYM